MNLTGKITKILANFYYVQDKDGKIWECFARARLLKEGKLLFVGDELEIETSNPTQGVIVDLQERKNKITKPPVANIDQILIVFSVCEPDFDFYNLDRYLSFVQYELPDEKVIVCINKIDLKKINIDNIYKKSNSKVFYISALTKEGLNDLASELSGKTTVLAGPSGVGKSSIIKALAPDEDIKIGSLSAIKTGKHITRNVQLILVNCNGKNGFLVDSPGFTQFSFAGLNVQKISGTFPELNNIGCNFKNCLHNGEEGCVMESLLKSKSICESRFESYLKILEEAQSKVIYNTKQESKVKTNKFLPKIDQLDRQKSRKKAKQELLKSQIESEEN